MSSPPSTLQHQNKVTRTSRIARARPHPSPHEFARHKLFQLLGFSRSSVKSEHAHERLLLHTPSLPKQENSKLKNLPCMRSRPTIKIVKLMGSRLAHKYKVYTRTHSLPKQASSRKWRITWKKLGMQTLGKCRMTYLQQ